MNPPPCSDHSRIWTIDLALVLLEVLLHTAVLVQSVGFLSRFRLQWLCTEVLMRCHAHYCIRYRYVDILVLSTVPTITAVLPIPYTVQYGTYGVYGYPKSDYYILYN